MFLKILFALICFPTIHANSLCNTYLQRNAAQEYNLNDSLLCIWKNDTNGCLFKRLFVADSLLKEESIFGMPKDIFVLLFGKPDYNSSDGVLSYGVGFNCDNQKRAIPENTGKESIVIKKDEKVLNFGFSTVN